MRFHKNGKNVALPVNYDQAKLTRNSADLRSIVVMSVVDSAAFDEQQEPISLFLGKKFDGE